MLQIHFAASNNVAEYEALIHGLNVAKDIGVRRISCFGDSDLVVQQASGTWDALDANMASYRFHVQQISGYFEGCEFHHVRRENNEKADVLSKLGSYRQAIPPGVSLEHLRKPSIKPSPESESILSQPSQSRILFLWILMWDLWSRTWGLVQRTWGLGLTTQTNQTRPSQWKRTNPCHCR